MSTSAEPKVSSGVKTTYATPYKSKKLSSDRSMANAVSECQKDCEADPMCAGLTVYNPRKGSSICTLADARGLARATTTPDARSVSIVMQSRQATGSLVEPAAEPAGRYPVGSSGTAVQSPYGAAGPAAQPTYGSEGAPVQSQYGVAGPLVYEPNTPSARPELPPKLSLGVRTTYSTTYKSKKLSSKRSMANAISECQKDCAADPKCAGLSVYNPKNGDTVCTWADEAGLEGATTAMDDRAASVVMRPLGPPDRVAPPGREMARLVGTRADFKAYDTKFAYAGGPARSALAETCKLDCQLDRKCAVVSVSIPRNGAQKCAFGNAEEAAAMRTSPDPGSSTFLVKPEGQPKKQDGDRFDFKSYRTKEYDVGLTIEDTIRRCKAECVGDRKCRIVAAETPKEGGKNKCYFGDAVAAGNYVTTPDPRWRGALVGPKAPLPPGEQQRYGFTEFRSRSYDAGRPMAEALELCKRECGEDRKCRVVALNSPSAGPLMCYLGDEQAMLKKTVTDDDAWYSATLPVKAKFPEGYRQRYDFKAYKTETMDTNLPGVEVHEMCKRLCVEDPICSVVATRAPAAGKSQCLLGDTGSLTGMKAVDDDGWHGSVIRTAGPAEVTTQSSVPTVSPLQTKPPAPLGGASEPGGYKGPTLSPADPAKEAAVAKARDAVIAAKKAKDVASLSGSGGVDPFPMLGPLEAKFKSMLNTPLVLVGVMFGAMALVLAVWMACTFVRTEFL